MIKFVLYIFLKVRVILVQFVLTLFDADSSLALKN